jgi:hypothetical protein
MEKKTTTRKKQRKREGEEEEEEEEERQKGRRRRRRRLFVLKEIQGFLGLDLWNRGNLCFRCCAFLVYFCKKIGSNTIPFGLIEPGVGYLED